MLREGRKGKKKRKRRTKRSVTRFQLKEDGMERKEMIEEHNMNEVVNSEDSGPSNNDALTTEQKVSMRALLKPASLNGEGGM